jgi:hypothetical protein
MSHKNIGKNIWNNTDIEKYTQNIIKIKCTQYSTTTIQDKDKNKLGYMHRLPIMACSFQYNYNLHKKQFK